MGFLVFNIIFMCIVQPYKEDCKILRICSAVRPYSPEQHFQMSGADNAQIVGQFSYFVITNVYLFS